MSYRHIDNLYKARDILLFKECYATEKIHGSSSHVTWKDQTLSFFSGGEKYESFIKIFNCEDLKQQFITLGYPEVVVFGEVYGGKCQGMSETYGKEMKFIAFEVKVDENWLNVSDADDVVKKLGLEFVHYRKILATIEAIDAEILLDSVQAIRNGVGIGHKREGIVLRPLIELIKNNGDRIIAKHKREDFQETKTTRPLNIDPEKLKILEQADQIAEEWVTEMRLRHILQQIPEPHDISKCGEIARIMVEDVLREGCEEIIDSKEARKSIGRKAIKLFKQKIESNLHNSLSSN